MALNILAPLVAGLAGLGKAAATISNANNKTSSSKTGTSSSKTSTPTYNEHQQYIQDTFAGGLDAYTKLQNDRYNTALQNNDIDLLSKLQADSQRVGYSLTPNYQVQPVIPQMPQLPDYSKELNDLLSAVQNYQPQMPNMPYPDISQYGFGDIQKQLEQLTGQLQNYEGAKYMNMDEAIARANSQLGGMYNQSLEQALEQYNKNAISRGMFGQLPVEALKQNAMAENELNKSNAVNALGANLYSQDFDIAQRKNQEYYQQLNQLADMLGQQYNTEYGMYQGDLNKYNTMYNQAKQADQAYFDNIARQLDILGTQYNLQQNEIANYANNIGQYSNDYMAEILKLQNDNDPSNDWKIAYLQNARNQKIAGQNEAETQAQKETYNQAMDLFGKLGYATGWVAQMLGVPEGTTTATYARLNTGGSGGSSGGSSSNKSNIDMTELTQQARLIASAMYPDGFTQYQLKEIVNALYKFWQTGDISALRGYVPSRSPETNENQFDTDIMNYLQQ